MNSILEWCKKHPVLTVLILLLLLPLGVIKLMKQVVLGIALMVILGVVLFFTYAFTKRL